MNKIFDNAVPDDIHRTPKHLEVTFAVHNGKAYKAMGITLGDALTAKDKMVHVVLAVGIVTGSILTLGIPLLFKDVRNELVARIKSVEFGQKINVYYQEFTGPYENTAKIVANNIFGFGPLYSKLKAEVEYSEHTAEAEYSAAKSKYTQIRSDFSKGKATCSELKSVHAEIKAAFQEKIALSQEIISYDEASLLERSINRIQCQKPQYGEVSVGSGQYFLRPGSVSIPLDGREPLIEEMNKANYVVNLMEKLDPYDNSGQKANNPRNPFKNGIPNTQAKYVENFGTWLDRTPPPVGIIKLAKQVVDNSDLSRPDMVFCGQGLQRTSTFVAITELIRNKECWEKDRSNNTARKVIATVLREMATQDFGRLPTESQFQTLLSDEFIDKIRTEIYTQTT